MGVQGSQAGGQKGKRMSTENQKFRNLEIQKFFRNMEMQKCRYSGRRNYSSGPEHVLVLGGRGMGGRGYGSVMGLTG